MPTRNASATWEGGIRSGKGTFEGESGAIRAPFSFNARFENEPGTNPEELIAAALASCYSMALSGNLEAAGAKPSRITTRAACTVEKAPAGGFHITTMRLVTRVSATGIDAAKFQEVANATKEGCPVSKALKGNMKMELDAALE